MLVSVDEMTTVVARYKLAALTDYKESIARDLLSVAEAQVFSYLTHTYNVETFSAISRDRVGAWGSLAVLKEIIKDFALYALLKRHNIDLAYSRVKETVDQDIAYLKHVSEGKITLIDLPRRIDPATGSAAVSVEFGSHPKKDFNY